ncbi:hypothetical protein LXJ58_30180, partial [Escherichia coli]|nr:hypothetical protein [Escherichia coli]
MNLVVERTQPPQDLRHFTDVLTTLGDDGENPLFSRITGKILKTIDTGIQGNIERVGVLAIDCFGKKIVLWQSHTLDDFLIEFDLV